VLRARLQVELQSGYARELHPFSRPWASFAAGLKRGTQEIRLRCVGLNRGPEACLLICGIAALQLHLGPSLYPCDGRDLKEGVSGFAIVGVKDDDVSVFLLQQ